jgi:hypothetical protein
MLLFVSMFGCIGLALLIFLWSAPTDGFHSPPLFFRLFGSCIAICFMAVGFGLPISALRARLSGAVDGAPGTPTSAAPSGADAAHAAQGDGYRCPSCGAALVSGQEVSPSGDVKCGYCRKWWNIHRGS